MKVWSIINKKSKTTDDSGVRRFGLITAAITVMLGGSIVFIGNARAAETMASYCKKYTVDAQKRPCEDGWQGKDCSEYKEEFTPVNPKQFDICEQADKARDAAGAEPGKTDDKDDTGTDGDKTDDKDDSSSSDSSGSSGSKSDSTTTKTKVNPDTIPDNNYGSYVNGAGNLQPMRVNRAPGDSRPAIIFFNGGGWHSDDGVGDKIAPWANERGYTTFVATYRLGSSGVYYMLDDVLRAIRHVRNNAGMYGIDPSRIAIWGDSAGGSLAMRAAGTGTSGAKVAVGWSAPTNAYTALFASARSFAIGMDHSTCVPTDLNGISNVISDLNGEEASATNDGGLGNNGTSGLSGANLVTSVLEVANQAQKTSTNIESISKKIESGDTTELSENVRKLAVKKIIECIDNFNSASPALFASGLSPPAFLAGYDTDPLVKPDQAYQMRDKLRALGIPSEALILPGLQTDAVGGAAGIETPGENHLDYNEKFVKPSLDFVDKFLHPEN